LSEEEVDTRVQATFEETKEDARSQQAGVVLDESLCDHHGGPQNHDERQPDARLDPLQHDVARDLGCNVERE
jgi:hypothetical protein